MTQENKELLLKDLSARLPYGLKCFYNTTQQICLIKKFSHNYGVCIEGRRESSRYDGSPSHVESWTNIDSIKPYLRPISSMTIDERFEYNGLRNYVEDSFDCELLSHKVFDWLNAHHFDYRGLIEKGLALEASADMYDLNK